MSKEWRNNLKAGDTVIVSGGFHALRRDKVSRVTKTKVIIGHRWFNKADGHAAHGPAWAMYSIAEPTPKLIDKVARLKLVRSISNLTPDKLGDVSTGDLARMWAIYHDSLEAST